MTINWKQTAIVLVDLALAVYLVLAITAFNTPDESDNVCREVNIHIMGVTGNPDAKGN